MKTEHTIFLGLGSNVGNPRQTLKTALAELTTMPELRFLAASSVYDTLPVGLVDQPNFLNMVAAFKCKATPEVLLTFCHEIERRHGRDRKREERNGPRTLDIDILLFEGERRNSAELTIPHPRAFERAFVVVPLEEIMDSRVLEKEFTCERLVKKLKGCACRSGVHKLGTL